MDYTLQRLRGQYIRLWEDALPGGKADDMSLEDIAKHHKVDVDVIEREYRIGVKVEMEHTDDKKIAQNIAKDHIWEICDYYTRLDKMERDAK